MDKPRSITFLLLTFQGFCLFVSRPIFSYPYVSKSHLVVICLLYNWSTTYDNDYLYRGKDLNVGTIVHLKWAVCQISLFVFFFFHFLFAKFIFFCMGCDAFTPFEGVQGSVGFWIPRLGFRIPCTVHVFVDGTCHLDSNRWWDSAGARTIFPDSEFYRQLNQEGRNLDSFTWGDTFYRNNI